MNEELYTVSFAIDRNYNGRSERKIRTAPAGCGTFMDKATAELLCRVLRPKYPTARPVEIFRNDRDELCAHSLADLGEDGLNDLRDVIERFIAQDFDREGILAKVCEVFDALAI